MFNLNKNLGRRTQNAKNTYNLSFFLSLSTCPCLVGCQEKTKIIRQATIKELQKMLNFKYFSSFGPFLQNFGQFMEWRMLELHERIRMWHVIACPIVLILLCCRDRQRGVLKPMKDDPFLVCQLFRTFSPNFWVVKECLILELLEMIRVLPTCSCLSNGF